jgi:hypothetical protein
MLRLRSVFNNIFTLACLILFVSCNDIPRDNILDPKNPNSYRALTISLEAFVNTENDFHYNEHMLSALKTVVEKYPEKSVFLQYHRNTTNYTDSLAIPANEIIYEQYISKFDNLKGVPDVFINGSIHRVKGASSVEAAVERIDDAIQPLLIENSHFTIEPVVVRNNSQISMSAKIARLGSHSVEDIVVRLILAEMIDNDLRMRVVRVIENSNLVPRLEPGEQKEIKFSDITFSTENDLYAILTILSNQDLIVHQTIEVAVP